MTYKIRINLNSKENVFRDVEIKGKQNLWNLHLGIKSAFSLMGEELSCFYFSDSSWLEGRAIPLEDMSDKEDDEIMSDIYVDEGFPEIGAKMIYKYGFIDLWEFACELIEMQEETQAVNYPITVYRFGNMPLKAPKLDGRNNNSVAAFLASDFHDDFDEINPDNYDNLDEEEDNYYDDDYDDQD